MPKDAKIKWFGYEESVDWVQEGGDLTLEVPKTLEESPAYAISIPPKPPINKVNLI